ncbi:glycoside hydrolase family 9 protein [Hamadaea tsunoensis]|uniref:glycoside hydrolase family 9 protein n=1 Tax=Hamadaea tsunoensis TaxID=53368 RepID=UPI000412F90E|nr:glycoside hydrolase family 9 protein [Hamadaea tsunoensis]
MTHRVLVPHLGLSLRASKAVVVELSDGRAPREVTLVTPAGAVALTPGPVVAVDRWHRGPYCRVPLPADLAPGTYAVRVVLETGAEVGSPPFEVAEERLLRQTLSDVLAYFKAMRSSGEIDRKDRRAALWGGTGGRTVDARGGWLDASGDTSKFLSHLTYTATMSPQQIPLCAWAMATALRHDLPHPLAVRVRDEALWGADFLVRFRAPEGYFYTGIFDALTKNLDERFVTAPLPDCVRTDRYQAGYRQGGGLAIAALAAAARLDDDGEFGRDRYLAVAVEAFEHLEEHNLAYLHDGVESIVDDYCALLAATELVASGYDRARPAADRRYANLLGRHVPGAPGWFVADATGRPFFHAAEAGLPILALLRYAEVTGSAPARELALRAMTDVLDRTAAVPNPFGYARQRVQPTGGVPADAFFFPHDNDTGYWWQGENATIASLAAAAYACAGLSGVTAAERLRLTEFGDDQLAWICGRNPFDVSMLQGRGRNNVDYESAFPNIPGGIVNGVTSGWTDEHDVAFRPDGVPEGDAWRWVEQWIPHTGWFLLAVAAAPR